MLYNLLCMSNISVAKESIRITEEGYYVTPSGEVRLPKIDYGRVVVISPEEGEKLISRPFPEEDKLRAGVIKVINADSYRAASQYKYPLVMNFANAHNPGGGFLMGANAQEEALCRCSTLYASITSEQAKEMYKYNNSHMSSVESDYMLISPNVIVFRNEFLELLPTPFQVGVVTIPAPNRRGAAMLAGEKKIAETFMRRIRILLRAAEKYGYTELVLGAWGCGAFGNPPEKVAEYFRKVLVDEGYGRMFNEVCFAIFGPEDGRNITAFRKVLDGNK